MAPDATNADVGTVGYATTTSAPALLSYTFACDGACARPPLLLLAASSIADRLQRHSNHTTRGTDDGYAGGTA